MEAWRSRRYRPRQQKTTRELKVDKAYRVAFPLARKTVLIAKKHLKQTVTYAVPADFTIFKIYVYFT